MTYHKGEIMVQAQAEETTRAQRVSGAVHSTLPLAARDFLQTQPLVVASVTDRDGRQWARLLPGPLSVIDEQTIEVPINLEGPVGLVILDTATRRRMRVNGDAHDGKLSIVACYANCPKYIQKRDVTAAAVVPSTVRHGETLSDAQQARVARADTFFIATRAPDSGADASHRGGASGFVRVLNDSILVWTDFAGNSMFNTLGNLAVNPEAGLLFVDFTTGDALSLSGRGVILWSGTERQVHFSVEQVEDAPGAFLFRASGVDYSPFNPPL